MDFIEAVMFVFKVIFKESKIVLIIDEDYYKDIPDESRNSLITNSYRLIISDFKDEQKTKETSQRVYGILEENILYICIKCPQTIIETVRNCCTSVNSFQLIY